MPLAELADKLWYGDATTSRFARALLSPLSSVFGAVVARRNASYDAAMPRAGEIPAISIGNLTVGGTGKTPVSAWFARRFREAGATPAIVMRGYGDDEVLVHRMLNPDVPVYGNPDRVAGVREAAQRGSDLAILDDAFQHRRAPRVADVVLISADRWSGEVRLLPAGPFREPLSSLRRASLVIITTKAASDARIQALRQAVQGKTSSSVVTVDISPASFIEVGSGRSSLVSDWSGRRVLAVSGIGDPAAFHAQLERLGVLTSVLSFADHHSYDEASVARIVAAARGMDAVVCTLKDAVKLGPQWPSSVIPLWYLSQSVVPRDDTEALDAVVRSVLQARRGTHHSSDLSR